MQTLEKTVERRFLEKLKSLNGCITIKLSTLGARGTTGWPDRLVLLPDGLAVFVELKAPGRTPTDLQHKKMDELRARGFPVAWFDDAERAFGFVLGQLRKQVVNG